MGVAPYKYFTFDGASSRTYDVYLTGEGVFNAPERAVEMIEIPGRNGNYALDQGRFQNITITYKAGIVDASESNFADKMSAVRNWLCSKVGYKRLEDDYNPNEYRMAVFKSGVTVDHEDLKTGEFEITFECKPQRWLTSGETATAVANNGTLSNPTLFASSPLVQFNGYGNMTINGSQLAVENVPIGDVNLGGGYTGRNQSGGSGQFASQLTTAKLDLLNTGDDIIVEGKKVTLNLRGGSNRVFSAFSITSTTNCSATSTYTSMSASLVVNVPTCVFSKGTNAYATDSVVAFTSTINGTAYTNTITIRTQLSGSTVQHYYSLNNTSGALFFEVETVVPPIHGDSTKSITSTMYIDCDIGEAYYITNSNVIVTLNSVVQLGSDLPTLAPGSNIITYSNTFSNVKITPRWWKV